MDTLSPDKVGLLLLNRNPILLNTLSAGVLVAKTKKNLGNCGLHGLPILGILAFIQCWLFPVPAGNCKLKMPSLSVNNLLSSVSSSSSSSILSSD